MRRRLYLVVPLLDEAANVDRLCADMRATQADQDPEVQVSVVVVDDGSTDGTGARLRDAAEGLDLTLLTHPETQGPGSAFGTAFERLADSLEDGDWVVTMEGDNTSSLELLRQLLQRSTEGYDVVLASPYMYGGGIVRTHPMRVLVSHLANTFVKEFLGIHGIFTVSSFYRLYSSSAIQRLQACYGPRIVERAGFESMVELLMKILYLEMTVSEVPMVLDTGLREGKSKMRIARTARGYLSLSRSRHRWQGFAQPHAGS